MAKRDTSWRITDAEAERLAGLDAKRTPGEWRAGRMDTETYDACNNLWQPLAQMNLSVRVVGVNVLIRPAVAGCGESDNCRPNAACAAAAVNALAPLLADRADMLARITRLEGLVRECLWAGGIAAASGDAEILSEVAVKADAMLAETQA